MENLENKKIFDEVQNYDKMIYEFCHRNRIEINDDIIQEGRLGIFQALSKYNKEIGEKSTYIYFYIKKYIFNEIQNDGIKLDSFSKFNLKKDEKYCQTYGGFHDFNNNLKSDENVSMNVSNKLDKENFNQNLDKFLSVLTKKNKEIIKMYFLEGKNFKEIGKIYGSSSQYIHLVVKDSLQKIKNNFGEELRNYLYVDFKKED